METFHMKSIVRVVLLVQSCMVCLAISLSNLTDQSALLAFKSAINYDPNHILGSNWSETSNFCNWIGVRCSQRRQRVTALRLDSMGLGGTISPHLGNLSFLRVLDLRNNSFHGFMTHELSQLRRLEILFLQYNLLKGQIPGSSIQQCGKLQVLSLKHNGFSGGIPVELTTLTSLRGLFMGSNNLTGTIPPSLVNMSNLEWFGLEENHIHGNIPNEIGYLPNLKGINLFQNYLTGSVPPEIFNVSSLQQLILSSNDLSGNLPSSTGVWLPNLEKIDLWRNQLGGQIPLYLTNSSNLSVLSLSDNRFNGPVPTHLGHLKLLKWFYLGGNQLTREPGSSELSFLTALTNSSSLQYLTINDNPLGGILPNSIGNLSSRLQRFYASRCQITGQIPQGIGSLNVNDLFLSDNNLHGTIPSTIGGMERLQRLYLYGNDIEGSIPDELCLLSDLGEVLLHKNKLSGPIPACIGNLTRLQVLFLNSNIFSSYIPSSLWSLGNLLFLNLSSNSLGGSLDPNIRPLRPLVGMDLSWNQISGKIPSTLGAFESLSFLSLSGNSFWGSIPDSFGNLITLDFLDLSHNNLSGTIPKTLEALSHLEYLNFSFNKLSGEIPNGGPFRNLTAQSFFENGALCGQPSLQVPSCTTHSTRKPWTKKFLKFIVPGTIALVVIILVAFVFMLKKCRNNVQNPNLNQAGLLPAMEHKMISYHEVCRATNDFCEANLLGRGSFGSVYKGILFDGAIVAVKILNLQLEGAFKSFDAECKVLRSVRHRNLVKVISTCTNPDLRALILQYMSNGSLEKWLYSHNYCLNLLQRVSIMTDVAFALEYLHYGQPEPVVHCDLKPSNVLLDEEMVAHVGDFGIAKILAENNTTTQTETLGTIGYIAPEYGTEGRVSTEGDLYSYGIMLLETFTRKKPTDEMFAGELTLRQWVNASLPDKIMEVVDRGLLRTEDGGGDMTATVQGHLLAIMELGLECSAELPDERSDIKDAVIKLNKIKYQLLSNERA